ncbi:hypothetical protein [Nocardia blacklockiae]|uniref:hypothetical protein n=1 Tax=Nocardia blacklockiae TaxID=480036 RepID=UPI0018941374|nr:hypothetical protein [Nocardia blacklockiae]MBF6174635.1 hypothetical protein [Nocardia blacklockiae]
MGADTGRSNRPTEAGPKPATGFGPPLGPPEWLMRDVPAQRPGLTWQPSDPPAVAAPTPPPPPEWALDPDVVQRTLAPPPRKTRRVPGRIRVVLAVALVATGVAVGAIVTLVVGGARDEPGAPVAAPIPPKPFCAPEQTGGLTIGNGPGDTASGTGAILGFEHAYYAERSGRGAQAFVAPDTVNVSDAENMQRGIDAEIPIGTVHCVRVVERAWDSFDVDIEERRPNGTVNVYKQHMRTVIRDGRHVVYEISDR